MEKIKIGIASCLLGNPVRWNGGHKKDRFIVNTLGQHIDFCTDLSGIRMRAGHYRVKPCT